MATIKIELRVLLFVLNMLGLKKASNTIINLVIFSYVVITKYSFENLKCNLKLFTCCQYPTNI